MRLKAVVCFIGLLIVANVTLAYAACSNCRGSKSYYRPITVSSPSSLSPVVEVCAPANLNLSVSASNSDLCGDPYPVSDSPLSYVWTGAVTGSGSSKTFQATSPGIYYTTCTVDDDGQCYNNGSTAVAWTIKVKGLTGLGNPGNVHRDAEVTLTASGTFGATGGNVSWSGLGSNTSYSGAANSVAATTYTTGGPKTVTATYCGSSFSVSFIVLVPCTDCTPCECDYESTNCSLANPCNWYDAAVGNPCKD